MRPDDLRLLHWPQDPRVSPDGDEVAWTEVTLDLERDEPVSSVMVAAGDGSGAVRRFSEGPHDLHARWSPDGRYLAYLSASDGPPALKLAPLAGGSPVSVDAPGPVTGFAWSPAGDRLVLVVNVGGAPPNADDPRSRNAPRVVRGLFSRLDGAGWLEGRDHLFVHDVEGRSTTQLTNGDFDHASPAWSPDGSTIAFCSNRSRRRDDALGKGDLWTISARAGRGRRSPIRVAGDIAGPGHVSYSPDGTHIAFTGVLGTEQTAARDERLLVVPSDGSAAPEAIAPGVDRPIGVSFGPTPYAWIGNDELLFIVSDHAAVHLYRSRLGERSARLVVGGDRLVSGITVPAAGGAAATGAGGAAGRIAFTSGWIDAPQEVFTLEIGRRGRQPVQVSSAGDEMRRAVALLPAERFRAEAPDGLEIEYLVVRQARRAGKAAAKPPLFVEIHGGPHMHHPMAETFVNYQILAGAGYTLVLPNPRGSTSYGEKFTALGRGDWGDGPLGDVLACADDAIERGLADGGRQFVGGYSFGGYLSSFAVGRTSRFKAATIGAPVTDLVSMFGTSDANVYFGDALDGDPWTSLESFRQQSPVTHAGEVKTPVFLFVNEGDLRCPPGQADQFYSALKYHGVEIEYARYPGGSHMSFFPMAGAPSQNEDRHRRILDWCARHGGLPQEH